MAWHATSDAKHHKSAGLERQVHRRASSAHPNPTYVISASPPTCLPQSYKSRLKHFFPSKSLLIQARVSEMDGKELETPDSKGEGKERKGKTSWNKTVRGPFGLSSSMTAVAWYHGDERCQYPSLMGCTIWFPIRKFSSPSLSLARSKRI